jgi:hypothetical protein
MKKVFSLSITLVLLFSWSPANGAALAGEKCQKAGVQKLYKNKIYTCIKLGSKLYWNNGEKFKTDKNLPKPLPIPAPLPTPAPTVSQLKMREAENIVAKWTTINDKIALQITWDAPGTANGFLINLTARTTTVPFGYSLNKSSTKQTAIITAQDIRNNFAGIFETNLTGLLKSIYIDTYAGAGVTFNIPVFVDALDGAPIVG